MDFDLIFSLMETFLALAAVLALAYFVLRFGKRVTDGGGGYVKIVEKTPLTSQSFLAVIKVGEDYHLASVTSGEVKILKDLDRQEMEASLEARRRQLSENPLAKVLENPVAKLLKMRKDSE